MGVFNKFDVDKTGYIEVEEIQSVLCFRARASVRPCVWAWAWAWLCVCVCVFMCARGRVVRVSMCVCEEPPSCAGARDRSAVCTSDAR